MSINNKIVCGVAGSIASGKTFLCKQLQAIASEQSISLHIIQVDEIRRYILDTSQETNHIRLREQLAQQWITNQNIFTSDTYMKVFASLINPEIRRMIREKIHTYTGIILVERAMIIKDNMQELMDTILFVACSSSIQTQRLADGDLWQKALQQRIHYQNQQKIYPSQAEIERNKWIYFDTSDHPNKEKYTKLFTQIISVYE